MAHAGTGKFVPPPKLEITGPEPESGLNVLVWRRGTKVLVRCDCDCGDLCPMGMRQVSQERCRVWMEVTHVTEAKTEATRRENTFDR